MFEARITYENSRKHTIEANNIEILKSKCDPYISNKKVIVIEVIEIKNIGWFKNPFDIETL